MRHLSASLLALMAFSAIAYAQVPLPLTEWRARVDARLSKLNIDRDAHSSILGIMQDEERQAQIDKIREAAKASKSAINDTPGASDIAPPAR